MKIKNISGRPIHVDGKPLDPGAMIELDDFFKKSQEFKNLKREGYIEKGYYPKQCNSHPISRFEVDIWRHLGLQ